MKAALVGLPQSGRTTLFQIFTGAADAPASRQEDALGLVRVPDARLERLSDLMQPKKKTAAAHELIDPAIAFPRAGGRERKGEGDPFIALRTCDLLVCAVRAFGDPSVPHAAGSVDPARDLARVEEELVLSDHVLIETRLERIDKLEKVGKKPESAGEKGLLERLRAALEGGGAIRAMGLSADEEKAIRGYGFLSHKPLIAVWNAGEGEAAMLHGDRPSFTSVAVYGRTELDLLALPADERAAFRAELGVAVPGVDVFLRAAHRLLGLVTFFTAGAPEVKAWQIPLGASAVDAAGKIHSDLARGFIRCEVVTAGDLLEAGTWGQARERGRMRTEGREYRVQDGDCLLVLFKN